MAFDSQSKSGMGTPFLSLMRVAVLLVTGFLYTSCAVCESPSKKVPQPMVVVVEKDNGRTVDIRLGGSVRIVLPENATTGYRWAVDRFDEEFIEAVSTEPHYADNALGSGGNVEFIFKGKKIGTGKIMLKEWRHWEGDASIINRFFLNLSIS